MTDKIFASLFFSLCLALIGASLHTALKIDFSMFYADLSPFLHAAFKFMIGALISGFIGVYILQSSRPVTA